MHYFIQLAKINMISKQKIEKILQEYDKNKIAISTVCSHSSLQIFAGAKQEGFKTVGICLKKRERIYDAFPLGKPNEFITIDNYTDIFDIADELIARNAIIIPHGSLVEYFGSKNFEVLAVPSFGNRAVLEWESDRKKSRDWLCSAGVTMPAEIHEPKNINKPVLVKYYGAKGGRGFFIARNNDEFQSKIDRSQPYTIQELVIGNRYYPHYFYSPLKKDGYRVGDGSLELLGMDRRDETNIDGSTRFYSMNELLSIGIEPSFIVCGNTPLIIRESILQKIMDIGEKTVLKSIELFNGLIGPFCLESIITDKFEIVVFEVSARIVAGTNLYISGSPYSDLIEEKLSTGRRIAKEIKYAIETEQLNKIVS